MRRSAINSLALAVVAVGLLGLCAAQEAVPPSAPSADRSAATQPATAPSAFDTEQDKAELKRLVEQLGHKDFAVREAAEKKLTDLAYHALEALKAATGSPDPEVSQRAKRAMEAIGSATLAEQRAMRQEAEAAFKDADYARMARLYGRLICHEARSSEDFLGLARAHQMAGDWRRAVWAWKLALEEMDFALEKGQRVRVEPSAPETGGSNMAMRASALPPPPVPPEQLKPYVKLVPLAGPNRTNVQQQRLQLIKSIGLGQREELKDLAAAEATFALGANASELLWKSSAKLAAEHAEFIAGGGTLRKDVPGELPAALQCLRELAATQERAGRTAEAIESCLRLNRADQWFRVSPTMVDNALMLERLVGAWPADKPLPELPTLTVLSADKPSCTIDVRQAAWRARSFEAPGDPDRPNWQFQFVPPPGMEFASFEATLDIEQQRFVGGMPCLLTAYAGGKPGNRLYFDINSAEVRARKSVSIKKDLPKDIRGLYVGVAGRPEFVVYGVTMKATFRKSVAGPASGPER